MDINKLIHLDGNNDKHKKFDNSSNNKGGNSPDMTKLWARQVDKVSCQETGSKNNQDVEKAPIQNQDDAFGIGDAGKHHLRFTDLSRVGSGRDISTRHPHEEMLSKNSGTMSFGEMITSPAISDRLIEDTGFTREQLGLLSKDSGDPSRLTEDMIRQDSRADRLALDQVKSVFGNLSYGSKRGKSLFTGALTIASDLYVSDDESRKNLHRGIKVLKEFIYDEKEYSKKDVKSAMEKVKNNKSATQSGAIHSIANAIENHPSLQEFLNN